MHRRPATPWPRLAAAAAALALASAPVVARAASFADHLVSYTPGAASPGFRDPLAALGSPDDLTGDNPVSPFGPPNVTSPFSPPWQADEIVQVGEGGQITLRLANFALVGPGREIGLFSNVGLEDAAWPAGLNTNPANTFGRQRPITVEVSEDGSQWVTVSTDVRLEQPTLYYVNAGPYDTAPPDDPVLADFGIPFEGTLATFDGKDWAGTLAALETPAGHSAGGTWLDLSDTGLTRVAFVRLSLPDNGDAVADAFNLDAVAIANSATGPAVPEPGLAGLLLSGSTLLLRRRR